MIDTSNIQITKDCIQKVSNIGHDVVYNICNNQSYIVPWGSADWIFNISMMVPMILVGVVLIIGIVLIIIGAISIIKEKWTQK